MVRLFIPLIAILLIWLLFFSPFSKRLRIGLSAGLIIATVFGLWLDTNGRGVNAHRIQPSEVVVCGVTGSFSYRNNYNLDLCLRNAATRATVKRLTLQLDAQDCAAGACTVLDSLEETVSLTIASGAQVQHTENVAFKTLPENLSDLSFNAQVIKVWASK